MQAGLLRDIITFSGSERKRDELGGTSEAWMPVFEKRAYVRFKSGSRKETNSEVLTTSVITITIRYCRDVTEKMRITYEGAKYRIISINRDRLQQSTVIEAEAINE